MKRSEFVSAATSVIDGTIVDKSIINRCNTSISEYSSNRSHFFFIVSGATFAFSFNYQQYRHVTFRGARVGTAFQTLKNLLYSDTGPHWCLHQLGDQCRRSSVDWAVCLQVHPKLNQGRHPLFSALPVSHNRSRPRAILEIWVDRNLSLSNNRLFSAQRVHNQRRQHQVGYSPILSAQINRKQHLQTVALFLGTRNVPRPRPSKVLVFLPLKTRSAPLKPPVHPSLALKTRYQAIHRHKQLKVNRRMKHPNQVSRHFLTVSWRRARKEPEIKEALHWASCQICI